MPALALLLGARRPPVAPVLALLLLALAPGRAASTFVRTDQYETRRVRGWTVRVNRDLLTTRRAVGEPALELLDARLLDVSRAVPARALAQLQRVPIWLGVSDGHAPCAEYHPSADWLRENGYNPDKAKAVEIGSAERFLDWSRAQPSMVLHELAHAYHDQVLGFEHEGIRAAHRAAVASRAYEQVLRADGRRERHYALTDAKEYFAEATEAFFGTNDFYPFVRAELEQHDPRAAALLRQVWGVPEPKR
jgi:hypothetical protein